MEIMTDILLGMNTLLSQQKVPISFWEPTICGLPRNWDVGGSIVKDQLLSAQKHTMACSHAMNGTHTLLRETMTLNAVLGGTVLALGGDRSQCFSIAPHGERMNIAPMS